MPLGIDREVAVPTYVRRVDLPGGTLKRWSLHTMLRLTSKRTSFIDADIDALRIEQRKWDDRFARVDPRVRRTPIHGADFAGEWIDCPESRPSRVILYFHGGAFVFRWPRVHAGMIGRWCSRLKARALMVDYRLAPEHPFPAAPDDCLAAYRWLLAEGYAPRDIVLAGDSAGANLALVTLQRIGALAQPMPACGVLLSVGVDFTLSSPSLVTNEANDPMFDLSELVALRGFYAPPERYVDPAVSPLFGEFAGFPPLLFQVGSSEALLDESTRAAARAHAAGVDVEVEIWEHMGHVFQVLPLPQAESAMDRIVQFIERRAGWQALAQRARDQDS